MVCSIYPTDPLLLELTVSQMENTITELQETTRSLMVRVAQLEGLHQRVKGLEHVWIDILLKLVATTPPTV